MALIKILDQVVYLIQEVVYLFAIIGYKAYQYRWLIAAVLFIGVCFIGGLCVYCMQQ